MKKFKFMTAIFAFLALSGGSIFAHESAEPITISCGLKNHFLDRDKRYFQSVTYAIPTKVLEQHWRPDEISGQLARIDVPLEIKIKTSTSTIAKAGNVRVIFWQNGTAEVLGFSEIHGTLGSGVFWEYFDETSFKESINNEVISCKIFP